MTSSKNIRQINNLAYVPDGGYRQQGDLYLPKGEGPWPVAVVIHGGGWNSRDRSDMADISRKLAGNNIAAFNINYRLAPEDRYPAQLNDVYAAMNFLVRSADEYPLDTQRMMTVGYSAGAHLALLAGSIPKEGVPTVNAIIAGGAPTDLRIYPDSPFIKDLIGGPPSDFPDVYREASPIVHATADHPPVFLYHGRLDLLVRPVNSFKMKAALEEAGVDVRLDIRALFGHLLTFAFDGPSISKGITFAKEYL